MIGVGIVFLPMPFSIFSIKMAQQITSFSLPKIGESPKTIQDRFASNSDGSLAALCDGAGSSLYPGKWAEILVQSFCNQESSLAKIKQSYQDWLQPAQEEWRQDYLEKLRNPQRKWWQGGSQNKDHGAATFLGLSLQKGKWQAVAVGDSCLFKLDKQGSNFLAFPLNNSAQFKSTTPCFASLSQYKSSAPQFKGGSYQPGDVFLLATDALAQWLLKDYETKGKAWQSCFHLTEKTEFNNLINQLRKEKLIKNDDTTLVLIKTDILQQV